MLTLINFISFNTVCNRNKQKIRIWVDILRGRLDLASQGVYGLS